jgi:hypothetical protein
MYPMLRVRNGRRGSGGTPRIPIHPSAKEEGSRKSISSIWHSPGPMRNTSQWPYLAGGPGPSRPPGNGGLPRELSPVFGFCEVRRTQTPRR